jgi:hypothetical protein
MSSFGAKPYTLLRCWNFANVGEMTFGSRMRMLSIVALFCSVGAVRSGDFEMV